MSLYYYRGLIIVDTGKRNGNPSSGLTDDNRNIENLSETIEEMREQLVKLVQEKGLSDGEVVVLSQRLDEHIVQFQIKMSRKPSK
ncbi:aspartyl-phosphate phosphatase Spo0E family protein [Brevibacillus borstelensis]|jgi:regulator of replication initiation timing|uniref:aspartyl-phosphate phosphatase Spo0E family protein n=1 Tax=Brevibacillus borstelensis TaxID=45462 RepID=UPI0014904A62|nr:aspartyl-phosphate phosphatase Spo0E family protein [Brevibacillus borstelensis]NOU56028.1 aspartyl-phosphate phosphatase Spo0E family protein [Brevibacillus borstelensis]